MWVFKASIRKILQLSSLTLQVRLKKKMLKSNSKISEESHILMAEIAMYPFTAFMSDIGGSAGLLLGLNVLGKIFSYLSNVPPIFRMALKIISHRFRVIKV